MSVPFQRAFSCYYDLLYADKNYRAEVDLIESVWAKYGAEPATILDAGCGSGGHALELASRGYCVTGVDRSTALLEIARAKAAARGANAAFVEGDLRTFELRSRFDACVCMFAALSFQLTNED